VTLTVMTRPNETQLRAEALLLRQLRARTSPCHADDHRIGLLLAGTLPDARPIGCWNHSP
jgi:hypothetical protein